MAIEVVEAPAIHEPMIHRVHGVLSPGRDCFVDQLVDLSAAGTGEREYAFGVSTGVAGFPLGECLEERLGEEHHEGIFVDDHAGCLIVSELRIEGEAELGEEVHRPLQFAHGQIDEYLPGIILRHFSLRHCRAD